jgi:small subunit ribosomal protein S16
MARAGKVKQAFFHIVVADSRSPRDGKIIEKIGYYNPRTNPSIVEVKSDRALYWISQGAQPSRTVYNLLKKKGIIGTRTGVPVAPVSAPQEPATPATPIEPGAPPEKA